MSYSNFTLTKGGPPKKIVPILLTITVLSAIVGMYAPPAVQDPHTTQILIKFMSKINIQQKNYWIF